MNPDIDGSTNATSSSVLSTETIVVQPYQWDYQEIIEDNRHRGELRAWGLNRESEPVLVRVRNYLLTAYLELPEYLEIPEATPSIPNGKINWTADKIEKLCQRLVALLDGKSNTAAKSLEGLYCGPASWNGPEIKSPLYYAGEKKSFVKLYFHSQNALNKTRFRACKPFWPGFGDAKTVRVKCQIWESDIPPMQKFTSQVDIAPSQWFTAESYSVPDTHKISTLNREYVVLAESLTGNSQTIPLRGIPEEETLTWETFPDILAFDIETYSANHKAFANKYVSTDICFMISVIFQKAKHPETRKLFLIVIGNCPEVKDTVVIRVADELSLVKSFCELINSLNPTVIVSYNGFAFDYPYLDARYYTASNKDDPSENWPACGRLKNYLPQMTKISWHSGAFGQINIKYLGLPGILNVDMYCVVKREKKLRKYSLDYVSRNLLGKGKHDVKPVEMNQIIEAFIKCHPAGTLQVDIDNQQRLFFNTSTTNQAGEPEIDERDGDIGDGDIGDEDIGDEDNEGVLEAEVSRYVAEKVDPLSPHAVAADELRKHQRILDLSSVEKILEEVSRFCEYCLQDAVLTVELFEEMLEWTSFHELSNAFRVNIVDTYTRGQQVKFLSQIYYTASRNNIVITQRNMPAIKFKGGLVQKPKEGFTTDVFCYDFVSMYPKIIKELNIDFTTLIRPESTSSIPTGDTENYREVVIDLPDDRRKIFHFTKNTKGLLPMICDDLVGRRNQTRKILKETADAFIKELLNARQLALKVAANSMFGVLGTQSGKYTLIEGAMSITSFGQELIRKVGDFVCQDGRAEIIYGDTDSVMVKFNCPLTGMDLQKYAEQIEHDINKMLIGANGRGVMRVELEKGMNIFCLTAKRYAARLLKNGLPIPGEKGLLVRGILLARRDNCQWQSDLYRDLLIHIIDGVGTREEKFWTAVNMIDTAIRDLYNGRVPWEKLLIAREMKSGYKSATAMMKVFSEESKKAGKPIQVGDRIEYIFVVPKDNKAEKAAGKRMRLAEAYVEALDEGNAERIDYDRYSYNILKNGVEQLFSIGFNDILEELDARYIQLDYTRATKNVLEEAEIRKYATGAGGAKRKAIIEAMWKYEYLRPRLEFFSTNNINLTKEILAKYLVPYIVKNSILPQIIQDNPTYNPMMIFKSVIPKIPLVKPEDLKSATYKFVNRRGRQIRKSRIEGEIVEVFATLYSNYNDVKDQIKQDRVLRKVETVTKTVEDYIKECQVMGYDVE
jgi:DNA polymerase elongation subunit (family B)